MSHVVTGKVQVDNPDYIRSAAKELGFEIIEKKSFAWYGRHVGDYPLPAGMKKEDLGRCVFAIHVPGSEYEYGVVKLPNGKYALMYDYWSHHGERLKQLEPLFNQTIGVQAAVAIARKNGKRVTRVKMADGTIRLSVR